MTATGGEMFDRCRALVPLLHSSDRLKRLSDRFISRCTRGRREDKELGEDGDHRLKQDGGS